MENWVEKFNLRDKVVVAKVAVGFIVMLGVSTVINQVIGNNTSSDSAWDRTKIRVGSFVLGFWVAEKAAKYTETIIDLTVEWWSEIKKELREASEPSEVSNGNENGKK